MLPYQPRFVYVLHVGGEDRVLGGGDVHPCKLHFIEHQSLCTLVARISAHLE